MKPSSGRKKYVTNNSLKVNLWKLKIYIHKCYSFCGHAFDAEMELTLYNLVRL